MPSPKMLSTLCDGYEKTSWAAVASGGGDSGVGGSTECSVAVGRGPGGCVPCVPGRGCPSARMLTVAVYESGRLTKSAKGLAFEAGEAKGETQWRGERNCWGERHEGKTEETGAFGGV